MAIEVFNRYERKFLINDETYQRLKECLSESMEADEHSGNGKFYTICNIYYDTPDNNLIRSSVDAKEDGRRYKEKLRLRSYGTVKLEDVVFLEIKKKYQKIVNKRRTKIYLGDAYEYLKTGEVPELLPFMNRQVFHEIDYMTHRMPLVPKLFLSYDRCAMFGKDDRDFRVTFDRNITTRRYDLGLHYGAYGDKLLPEGEWLMEIKIGHAMPMFMAELLSRLQIYPVSFSKYGTEYRNYVAAKWADKKWEGSMEGTVQGTVLPQC